MLVKEMIGFLNKFDGGQKIYLNSFNNLCGSCTIEVDTQIVIKESGQYDSYLHDEDGAIIVENYSEYLELCKSEVDFIKKYIEQNKANWSENKMQKEESKLKDAIQKTKEKPIYSPCIFINN